MKSKILALILALTVVSWTQTATQTAPVTTEQNAAPADTGKSCCDKMAAGDKKDMATSCMRHKGDAANGKEMSSCCGDKKAMSSCRKDSKSCMKGEKGKTPACCKEACDKDKTASACCGGKDKKGCCQSKSMEKAANRCCKHRAHA